MTSALRLVLLTLRVFGAGTASPAAARDDQPLAYMRAGEYRALERAEKVNAALDFMRSFCGSLTMPTLPFVECVNESVGRHSAAKPIFDELKACVRKLS